MSISVLFIFLCKNLLVLHIDECFIICSNLYTIHRPQLRLSILALCIPKSNVFDCPSLHSFALIKSRSLKSPQTSLYQLLAKSKKTLILCSSLPFEIINTIEEKGTNSYETNQIRRTIAQTATTS